MFFMPISVRSINKADSAQAQVLDCIEIKNIDVAPHKQLYSKIPSGNEGPVELFLPVPIPLRTAPSLTPEALVLLVGALWGARLGRNRHLARTTENRFITFTGANTHKIQNML